MWSSPTREKKLIHAGPLIMLLLKHRKPTHPGEVLLEEFLKPMNISQAKFVRHLGGSWTCAKLNEIIHEKRGITPDTAIDLAMALGTSPFFWMNLQMHYDLWKATQHKRDIEPIQLAM